MARKATGIGAWVRNRLARVHDAPVLIFGHEKSGTSAIANLLADMCGLTKTIDIPPTYGRAGVELMHGRARFADVVRRHPAYYASDVIKDPMMTFFPGQVLEFFPRGRAIFLVRDPRENIRSLFDRRKLSGTAENLSAEDARRLDHHGALDHELWGLQSENHVGITAQRWNLAVDKYLEYRTRMRLVRYEDFLADKLGCLRELAAELGAAEVHDVSADLDRDFQPRGKRGAKWLDYFGPDNLARIERICGERMQLFSYQPGVWN